MSVWHNENEKKSGQERWYIKLLLKEYIAQSVGLKDQEKMIEELLRYLESHPDLQTTFYLCHKSKRISPVFEGNFISFIGGISPVSQESISPVS